MLIMHFAFAVNIFSNSASKHEGYCCWINNIIAEHETSFNTIKAHKIWINTENRLNSKQMIDSEFQRCVLAEK